MKMKTLGALLALLLLPATTARGETARESEAAL